MQVRHYYHYWKNYVWFLDIYVVKWEISFFCAEVEREASHRCLPGEACAWQGKEGLDDTLKYTYNIDGIWQTKFHGIRLHHQLQPFGISMYKSILGYHHFESPKKQLKKTWEKGARGQAVSSHGWWRVPKGGVATRTSPDQIFPHIIWYHTEVMIGWTSHDWTMSISETIIETILIWWHVIISDNYVLIFSPPLTGWCTFGYRAYGTWTAEERRLGMIWDNGWRGRMLSLHLWVFSSLPLKLQLHQVPVQA